MAPSTPIGRTPTGLVVDLNGDKLTPKPDFTAPNQRVKVDHKEVAGIEPPPRLPDAPGADQYDVR